jgi:hypothetical protein
MVDDSSSPNESLAVIAILIGGTALSFAAAVVPHFDSAFRLDVVLLVSGLVPYLVYAVLAWFLRGRVRVASGVAVLGLHLLVVAQQRWITDGYAEGTLLYWTPLVLAALLLFLIPQAREGAQYPRDGRDA